MCRVEYSSSRAENVRHPGPCNHNEETNLLHAFGNRRPVARGSFGKNSLQERLATENVSFCNLGETPLKNSPEGAVRRNTNLTGRGRPKIKSGNEGGYSVTYVRGWIPKGDSKRLVDNRDLEQERHRYLPKGFTGLRSPTQNLSPSGGCDIRRGILPRILMGRETRSGGVSFSPTTLHSFHRVGGKTQSNRRVENAFTSSSKRVDAK